MSEVRRVEEEEIKDRSGWRKVRKVEKENSRKEKPRKSREK